MSEQVEKMQRIEALKSELRSLHSERQVGDIPHPNDDMLGRDRAERGYPQDERIAKIEKELGDLDPGALAQLKGEMEKEAG